MTFRKLKKLFMKRFEVSVYLHLYDKNKKPLKKASKKMTAKAMKECLIWGDPYCPIYGKHYLKKLAKERTDQFQRDIECKWH